MTIEVIYEANTDWLRQVHIPTPIWNDDISASFITAQWEHSDTEQRDGLLLSTVKDDFVGEIVCLGFIGWQFEARGADELRARGIAPTAMEAQVLIALQRMRWEQSQVIACVYAESRPNRLQPACEGEYRAEYDDPRQSHNIELGYGLCPSCDTPKTHESMRTELAEYLNSAPIPEMI